MFFLSEGKMVKQENGIKKWYCRQFPKTKKKQIKTEKGKLGKQLGKQWDQSFEHIQIPRGQ